MDISSFCWYKFLSSFAHWKLYALVQRGRAPPYGLGVIQFPELQIFQVAENSWNGAYFTRVGLWALRFAVAWIRHDHACDYCSPVDQFQRGASSGCALLFVVCRCTAH